MRRIPRDDGKCVVGVAVRTEATSKGGGQGSGTNGTKKRIEDEQDRRGDP